MVAQKIIIKNPTGLHLRPAGNLCKEAMKFKSKVTFIYDEKNVANAKSVLSVLGACIKSGDEIELICNGEDESEALILYSTSRMDSESSTQGNRYTWRNIYGEAFNHSRSGLQC